MAIELTPWLTLFWLIPVTYIHLRREAEFRPVTAGVALPPEVAEDPEVYALQIQYRRLLFWPCFILLAAQLAGPFLQTGEGVRWLLYGIWVDLAVVLPPLSLVWYHQALLGLRRRRGWPVPERPREGAVTVDLARAAQPLSRLPLPLFLIPLAVSFVPAVWDLARGNPWRLLALDALGPVLTAACVLAARLGYVRPRRRGNPGVDDALGRHRLRTFELRLLCTAWFAALEWLAFLLMRHHLLPGLALSAALLLGELAVAFVWLEMRLRRIRDQLAQAHPDWTAAQGDGHWLWALGFCYEPHTAQSRVAGPAGTGGVLLNLARPAGKAAVALLAALLLSLPLRGVWLLARESAAPASACALCVTDEALP